MAKTITQITESTPANPAASLSAGGSLDIGTTYYYRVFAFLHYQNRVVVVSVPTAEVSATPDAANRTITLSWDAVAGATGYMAQRTETSGVYLAGGRNSFSIAAIGVNSPCFTTMTSIVDIGTTDVVRFDGYNMDIGSGLTAIDISSDANDTITLHDIYAADVAGGWGVFDMMCPTGMKDMASGGYGTYFKEEIPYSMNGSIYAHDCKLSIRGMLQIYSGSLYPHTTTTTLLYGNSTYQYMPSIHTMQCFSFRGTNDNANWNEGYDPFSTSLDGTSDSRVYGLIKRNMLRRSGVYPYNTQTWSGGIKDITIEGSVVGLGAGNALPAYEANYKNNTFESLRHNYAAGDLPDSTIRYGFLSLAWTYNTIMTRLKTVNPCLYDIYFPGDTMGHLHIDPEYAGKGQTDNIPYLYVYCVSDAQVGNTLVIGYTLDLTVVDNNNSPIVGATVTINDVNGNSDLWEDSEATYNSPSLTTTSTALNVSDGTKFSVNDVIKIEGMAEAYLVTNIATNALTITRGYQGTTARKAYYAGYPRIFKQIADLTTDANGKINLPEFLVGRELASKLPTIKVGYENTLVANEELDREVRTPHTVTITKAGYPTRVVKYTMDKARVEVEKLSPDGTNIQDATIIGSTIY